MKYEHYRARCECGWSVRGKLGLTSRDARRVARRLSTKIVHHAAKEGHYGIVVERVKNGEPRKLVLDLSTDSEELETIGSLIPTER